MTTTIRDAEEEQADGLRPRRASKKTPAASPPGGDGFMRRHPRLGKLAAGSAVLGMLLGIVMALTMTLSPMAAADDPPDMSFYKLSSTTATFFGNAQSPEKINDGWLKSDKWKGMIERPATAGSFVGYPDSGHGGLMKWLTSMISGSSVTYNYDSFDGGKILNSNKGEDTSKANGIMHYAFFGATLANLGLDSTSTSLSLGIFRMIGGGIMLIAFVMAALADLVFWGMIKILQLFNPFGLFVAGVSQASPTLGQYLSGTTNAPEPGSALEGVASWVGGWYKAVYDFSWSVAVPLFLGFLVVSLLLFRKADSGSKIKKFLVRLMFISLGIPILGGAYTGMLNSLADHMGGSAAQMGASKVVLSTYVDFEKWATVNRLAVSDGTNFGSYTNCKMELGWDGYDNQPTPLSRSNLRNTTLCINTLTGAYGDPGTIISSNGSASGEWNSQPNGSGASESSSSSLGTVSLLLRYMDGSQISASDFETGVKAQLTQDMADGGIVESGHVKKWFEEYGKGAEDLKDKEPNHSSMDKGNPVLNTNQGLIGDGYRYVTFKTQPNTERACNYQVLSSDGHVSACNLSVMSMYNYLNTSFDAKSMTVYSSEKSSSGAIREMHNSVSQIGTGTMGFLYWFNSVTMLAAFAILGYTFALAMIIKTIMRSIQMITNVPFALLGAMGSIVKVIAYSISMVVEVIGTIFIYSFIQEFLLALPQIIEMPLANALAGDGGSVGAAAGAGGLAAALAAGGWLSMAILIVSTVALIWFTVTALKVRKSFVNGIHEAVTKTIEKFVGANALPPTGRGMGMPGKLAAGAVGAAGTGLGMAAANRMMGGSGNPFGPLAKNGGPGKLKANTGGTNGPGKPTVGPDGKPTPGSGGPGEIGPGNTMLALPPGSSDPEIGGPNDPNDPNGPGGVGFGGQGGAGGDAAEIPEGGSIAADGTVLDADGNPVMGPDGQPVVADSGSAVQTSEGEHSVETDDNDRALAESVNNQGGLSAVVPAEADPNKGVRESDAVAEERLAAAKDAGTGAAKGVVGAGETAVGVATENPEMVKDGAQRTVEGGKQTLAAGERAKDAGSSHAAQAGAVADQQAQAQVEAEGGKPEAGGSTREVQPGRPQGDHAGLPAQPGQGTGEGRGTKRLPGPESHADEAAAGLAAGAVLAGGKGDPTREATPTRTSQRGQVAPSGPQGRPQPGSQQGRPGSTNATPASTMTQKASSSTNVEQKVTTGAQSSTVNQGELRSTTNMVAARTTRGQVPQATAQRLADRVGRAAKAAAPSAQKAAKAAAPMAKRAAQSETVRSIGQQAAANAAYDVVSGNRRARRKMEKEVAKTQKEVRKDVKRRRR